MGMYEARQNKEKVSRVIDGNSKHSITSTTANRRKTMQMIDILDDNSGKALVSFQDSGLAIMWGGMKRHHIVARSKIKNFIKLFKENIDSSHNEKKITMIKAFDNWVSAAIHTHFEPGMIGHNSDTDKTRRLGLADGVTEKSVSNNKFNENNRDLFQELCSALQWTPGNIVPGPANRADDPKSMNDLDEPLLKFVKDEILYRSFDKMVNLTSLDNSPTILQGLEAAKKIYSIKVQRIPEKEKWVLANRQDNKWKVK